MKNQRTRSSAETKGRDLAGNVSAGGRKGGGRKVDGAANAKGRKLAQEIPTNSVARASRTRQAP